MSGGGIRAICQCACLSFYFGFFCLISFEPTLYSPLRSNYTFVVQQQTLLVDDPKARGNSSPEEVHADIQENKEHRRERSCKDSHTEPKT